MTADVPGVINKPKSLAKFLQHLEERMQILVTQMPIKDEQGCFYGSSSQAWRVANSWREGLCGVQCSTTFSSWPQFSWSSKTE